MSAESSINIREVASRQRWLLWGFLLLVLCNVGTLFFWPLAFVGLILQFGLIVLVATTMAAMRRHVVWIVVACIAMLLPLINLLILLDVNARATRVLRQAGLKVGLMGVNPREIPHQST